MGLAAALVLGTVCLGTIPGSRKTVHSSPDTDIPEGLFRAGRRPLRDRLVELAEKEVESRHGYRPVRRGLSQDGEEMILQAAEEYASSFKTWTRTLGELVGTGVGGALVGLVYGLKHGSGGINPVPIVAFGVALPLLLLFLTRPEYLQARAAREQGLRMRMRAFITAESERIVAEDRQREKESRTDGPRKFPFGDASSRKETSGSPEEQPRDQAVPGFGAEHSRGSSHGLQPGRGDSEEEISFRNLESQPPE